jgi:hypothetical protein
MDTFEGGQVKGAEVNLPISAPPYIVRAGEELGGYVNLEERGRLSNVEEWVVVGLP